MGDNSFLANVFERAADLIASTGLTKGIYEEWGKDGACAYCTTGAVLHVLGLDYSKHEVPPFPADALGFSGWHDVMRWNDADDRTKFEVIAKLREAAALTREQLA